MGVDRCIGGREQCVGDGQVDVGAADDYTFDIGDVVKLAAVHAGDIGVAQHVGAGVAQHGVAAAEIASERDRVVAISQVDAVVAALAGVHIVVAGAQAGNVVGRAQRDRVHRVGADNVNGFGFNAGIKRQVVACAGVHCGSRRQDGAVAQRDGHVGARDRDVFDVACAVECAGKTHIGVGQCVGAATEHHVGAGQGRSKHNRVVAGAEVNAVNTTHRGVNKIVFIAQADDVVATAQGDAVCLGRADDDDAVCFGCRIERQVAAARGAGSVQRRVGQQGRIHQRDVDVVGAVHVDAAEGADVVKFSRDIGVSVGVGQHVIAAATHDGVGAAQCGTKDNRVIASTEVDAVRTAHRGVDKIVAIAQADDVVATTQGDAVYRVGAEDVEVGQSFSRRVERQARAGVGVDRCIGGREQGVGDGQVDVVAADDHALNVGDIVEFTAVHAGDIGVDQNVGAGVPQHGVAAAEIATERNRVITGAQVDAVVADGAGIDRVVAGACVEDNVAGAGDQDVVARAADQGVVAAAADQGVADGVCRVASTGDDFSCRVANDAVRTRGANQAFDAGGTAGEADVGSL